MSSLPRVFADYVNFSYPLDGAAGVVDDLLDVVPGHLEREGVYRAGYGGTIKFGRRAGVGWCSLSGGVLQALRETAALDGALGVVGSLPHRVTTLHATVDLPLDAPEVLSKLYAVARRGEFALTRKAVPLRAVTRVVSPSADGRDTGTLYLGRRTSSVWLKVYDKRQHILDLLAGGASVPLCLFPPGSAGGDTGPLTRYELALGRKVGVTLRDVSCPGPVFWHFMARWLPEHAPSPLPAWAPHAEGFEVARPEPDLLSQLDGALDAPAIRRLGRIAAALGPRGVDLVAARVRLELERAAGAVVSAVRSPLGGSGRA